MKKLQEIVDIAIRKGRKKLVVASAEDPEILTALARAVRYGMIRAILVGNKNDIQKSAAEASFDLSDAEILHEEEQTEACITAVHMVRNGDAQILMKGNVRTGTLVKCILDKEKGLVSGNLLSHIAFFESPYYHKIVAVTDAALNIAPGLEDKIEIIRNALIICKKLGIEHPKVGILAAVEVINNKMEATVHAGKLRELNRENKIAGCIIDGPLALDNAISTTSAAHKGIVSEVAGDADILVVPDLNSGNILYKSLVFMGNASAAAMIAGAAAPVVLTSRSDSDNNKFFSVALAAALL